MKIKYIMFMLPLILLYFTQWDLCQAKIKSLTRKIKGSKKKSPVRPTITLLLQPILLNQMLQKGL